MFRMNYRTAVILAAVITLCCCAFSGPAAAEEAFVENEWNYVDRSMDVSRVFRKTPQECWSGSGGRVCFGLRQNLIFRRRNS